MLQLCSIIRFYLSLLLCLSVPATPFAQEATPVFYEFIKDDSVKMFFNDNYRFSEQKCATFTRYIRVDNEGNFNSYYRDYQNGDILLGTGRYLHGKKNGHFEVFYANGKIRMRGNFENDHPVGRLEYFYDSGLPERTIQIEGTDTLLITFSDAKGAVKVKEGTGEFEGPVGGNTATSGIVAKGKVEKGKPNGKWTLTYNQMAYAKEDFDEGKFVRGVFPNAVLRRDRQYSGRSLLNNFIVLTYLSRLEEFILETCSQSAKVPNTAHSTPSFDT
ncbi:MAG TPA: hypothetical protein VF490_04655, partial [Chryseosolibacter sp.]